MPNSSLEPSPKNIYPPINVLPSLSRLMKDGIGAEYTREDHQDVANQLFSSYARVGEARDLASVIGEDELSDTDKKYLEFGVRFEQEFVAQGVIENRAIEETLDIGWRLLHILPKESNAVLHQTGQGRQHINGRIDIFLMQRTLQHNLSLGNISGQVRDGFW